MWDIIGAYSVAPVRPACLASRSLNNWLARSMRWATVRQPAKLSRGKLGAGSLLLSDAA
jgi:hypothetical protein